MMTCVGLSVTLNILSPLKCQTQNVSIKISRLS